MKLPRSLRVTAFMPRSIAFRLIAAVLAVELAAAILTVALSYGFERHIHFHTLDVIMHGHMDTILGSVQESNDGKDDVMLVQADLHLPKEDVWEVVDSSGRVLGISPNWQGVAVDSVPMEHGAFLRLILDGHRYRLIRREGSRLVDPGEPGGGKLRTVEVVYGARTNRVWEAIWASVEFYALGSGLLLLATGPLIAWLLHRGLLPLRQLAALAAQVSANSWQFDPPESARNTPELAPLTLALESVLQRLERAFVQQRTFVSDSAHELKTAVAVVKSSLQLLSLKRRTAEEYQAGLERCLTDCLRIEDLVAKMLTLAREESATPSSAAVQATGLADCLRQTVAELTTVAAVREVGVSLAETVADAAGAAVFVPLAGEDCALLFSNLVLNALQHSCAGATVAVRLLLADEYKTALVEIEDHGEGITAEALPHVFERFYRGDPSRNRNTGGSGLGLAICKAIAERAGGSITLVSQPGVGTTVTVHLPVVEQILEEFPIP
jgi:signal transduction histidine kinase